MTDTVSADNQDTDNSEAYLAMQERAKGTNVDEQTLLATDYLNHFNEIVMMLEMVPDMPELLDEAKSWKPKSYKDHFRDSGISDRELAIEAYDLVPQRYRVPFEETVGQTNRLVATTLARLEEQLLEGNMPMVKVTTETATSLLHKLIEHASSNIHGSTSILEQSEIDVMMG